MSSSNKKNPYNWGEDKDNNSYNVSGGQEYSFSGSKPCDIISDMIYYVTGKNTNGASSGTTIISGTTNNMVYPSTGIVVSTGSAWSPSITDNSANWNTAYSNRITSTSLPLSISNNKINLSQASASSDGFITSGDYNNFTNKTTINGNGIVRASGSTMSYLTDNSNNWNTAYSKYVTLVSSSGTSLILTLNDSSTLTTQIQTSAQLATSGKTGVVKIGNGLSTDTNGLLSTKLSTGLKYDASYNIIPDPSNIDVTQLKNFSVITTGSPKGFFFKWRNVINLLKWK